jgi:H+-transporting ATPase
MATGDQLEIAKETGRRLGLGDNMYNAKALQTGIPPANCPYATLDEMILKADGFAGVFPEHKFEIVKRLQALGHLTAMTGDGANDAPALSRANVGVAVEGATDAARGAADIVLTEPGLSTIVEAIRGSRIIFQRMRNYSIYACAVTVRVVTCFALMAFAWKFDFPPFMILIVALLNDGTIMTLSLDRVLPSDEPDSWDLVEIFCYAIGYGLYLTVSTLVLFAVTIHTSFFESKFGVQAYKDDVNAPELHFIVYQQTSIACQALIFITRSKGWFFMEPPSLALFGAFCLAQTVSSLVAAYANWGFTYVKPISGGWIAIIWIWSLLWLFPLDLIKFGMRKLVKSARKSQYRRRNRHAERQAELNRRTSLHESMYASRTNFISRAHRRLGFGKGGKRVHINQGEIARVSTIQTQQANRRLSRLN